jgi:hypothetical protein
MRLSDLTWKPLPVPSPAKERYLAAVRAGGYGKTARREQLRLDALNRLVRARDGS